MEILLAAVVMGLCFAGLGLGLLLRSRRVCLKGSCGGASAKDRNPDISCPSCQGDPAKCESKPAAEGHGADAKGRVRV